MDMPELLARMSRWFKIDFLHEYWSDVGTPEDLARASRVCQAVNVAGTKEKMQLKDALYDYQNWRRLFGYLDNPRAFIN